MRRGDGRSIPENFQTKLLYFVQGQHVGHREVFPRHVHISQHSIVSLDVIEDDGLEQELENFLFILIVELWFFEDNGTVFVSRSIQDLFERLLNPGISGFDALIAYEKSQGPILIIILVDVRGFNQIIFGWFYDVDIIFQANADDFGLLFGLLWTLVEQLCSVWELNQKIPVTAASHLYCEYYYHISGSYKSIEYYTIPTLFWYFSIASIVNMHLTIKNRNKSAHHPAKDLLLVKTEPAAPKKISISPPIFKDSAKKDQMESKDRESCCGQWVFSKCLPQQEIQLSGRLLLSPEQVFEVAKEVREDKKFIEKESKIRVMSSIRKSSGKKQFDSKSLNKLKKFKQPQRQVTFGSDFKTKMSEILQTKRCTNAFPTPICSIQSSNSKQKQSIFTSMQLVSSQYLLRLNRSKQLHGEKEQKSGENIALVHNNILLSREGGNGIRGNATAEEQNGHLRQSSNELKINDPFEENKSHGTEYLKKKINFSEGKTEREALIDYLYEPIKIIDQSGVEDSKFSNKSKNFQAYRSLAIHNIEIENQHELTEARLNSEESVVLEKGLEEVFNRTLSHLRKQHTKETRPAESLNASVIRHDAEVEQEFF